MQPRILSINSSMARGLTLTAVCKQTYHIRTIIVPIRTNSKSSTLTTHSLETPVPGPSSIGIEAEATSTENVLISTAISVSHRSVVSSPIATIPTIPYTILLTPSTGNHTVATAEYDYVGCFNERALVSQANYSVGNVATCVSGLLSDLAAQSLPHARIMFYSSAVLIVQLSRIARSHMERWADYLVHSGISLH